MRIKPFTLERWQSIWENQVGLNLSESGVHPLSVEELVADPDEVLRILCTPLGYPQTNGSETLRARVAELYPGTTAQNVLMTSGCSEANFVCVWALVEPGDDVVFMQPNYMQISGVAQSIGASVTPLWLREASGWQLDLGELKKAITNRTKLVAICNPNNPTGAVMSRAAMDAVYERAAEVGAWVLSDEVYRGAEFEGDLTPTMFGKYERVLCTAGLSKAYALPGLRTGWIVGAPNIIDKLWGVHDYTSIGISMLTDKLATIALGTEKRRWILERTRSILRHNYGIVQQWLSGRGDFFRHIPPKAGGIAWLGYNRLWNSDVLVEELRRRKDMLLVPGTQFGMDQYLRIGFAGEPEKLHHGLTKIAELLNEFETESAVARASR